MSTKPIHRILTVVSIVSFFGSSAFAATRIINNPPQPPRENTSVGASVEFQRQLQVAQLQEQEQEYEIVLKQEPNNQVALEGLVETRLQMKNAKGAVEPLKKLTQLYPNQPKYKSLLAQVQQRVSEGKGDH